MQYIKAGSAIGIASLNGHREGSCRGKTGWTEAAQLLFEDF